MRTVILSERWSYNENHERSTDWLNWAQQYAEAHGMNVKNDAIIMERSVSRADAIHLILKGAKQAGKEGDGLLIFSVGHGTSTDDSHGLVQLSPEGSLTLVGANTKGGINVFYDVPTGGESSSRMQWDLENAPDSPRLKDWKTYQELAAGIKTSGIWAVLFLTCRVGNSEDFLAKIAKDWGVVVRAYKYRAIAWSHYVGDDRRALCYLESDPPSHWTNAATYVYHEDQLPNRDLVRISPPPLVNGR